MNFPLTSIEPIVNITNATIDIEDKKSCSGMDSETPFPFHDDSNSQNSISNSFIHTNAIRVETSLLKVIFGIDAPNYTFKDTMNWAKDAHCTEYMFDCK